MGNLRSKGCVALRFIIEGTSFAFMNCHLSAGDGMVKERLEMLNMIMKQAFSNVKFSNDPTSVHDLVFVFGDLNFRVTLKNHEARMAT